MSSSDYERDKQARKELAKAKVAMQNHQPVDDIVAEKIVPHTRKEKWDNFWYHYKFHVLGGVFALSLITTFIYSIVSKPKYDCSLVLVTQRPFDSTQEFFNLHADKILPDFDNNGATILDVLPITLVEYNDKALVDPNAAMANQAKLLGVLSGGENFLYLVDDFTYEELEKFGVAFDDIEDLDPGNERIDGDKYALGNSEVSRLWEMGELMEEYSLCIMDYSKFEKRSEDMDEAYNRQLEFLKSILAFG